MKKEASVLLTIAFLTGSLAIAQTQGIKQDSIKSVERVIKVDVQDIKGTMNTMFKECIGAGRANEGLRADWQRQLTYVKKECDFKYIRMHGLLTDDMGVYREDKNGNPQYNWQYIDEFYDFLLSIKIKPFVELSFMPSALASGNQVIFWWKGNVTPPKDYIKWENLIKNLVQHFTERYGENEVATWYFEVWNEPNLPMFFTGSQDEYFKLYDSTAKAVKDISSRYKVGGPATAGSGWINEMLAHCKNSNVPVDFIATHCYGVKQGFLDEFGQNGTILDSNPTSIYNEIKGTRNKIENSSFPGLELHYTEWSSSYTPADPIHDSYHEAAYILDKIKGVGDAATSMSYWVFTDIFEEPGPRFTPFHGGFGLINYQSINKPAFYAYQYLNKLGEKELTNTDAASWACKKEDGSVQILFWNFTITHPGDSVNNQVYYKRNLPSKFLGKVNLQLANLMAGKYIIEVYKTGYKANDVYTAYLELGSPNQLTIEQVAKLKKVSDGSPATTKEFEVLPGKQLIQDFELHENDVYFVNIAVKKKK
jgi:xylan 1,4-beta-xylosidase